MLAIFGIVILFSIFAIFIFQKKNLDNKANNDKQLNLSSVNKSLTNANADEACNPLVPKHITTPFKSSLNQVPPPLPPKLSRQAQLYQNLGSSNNTHTNNINGLPTVEVCFIIIKFLYYYFFFQVRPIQSVIASSRILNENNCLNSPLLIKQRQNNFAIKNNSTASDNNSIKSDISRKQPQPPPHQRNHQTGNNINQNNNLKSCCSSAGLAKQNCCTSIINQQNSPMLEFNLIENKQKKNLFQNIEKNKITEITQNVIKEQEINKSNKFKTTQKKLKNNDYLTMKPIHRAKPFIAQSINENSQERPPTPPAHRPLIQKNNNNKCICNLIDSCTGECVLQLYDNPNDSTNSNIIKANTKVC